MKDYSEEFKNLIGQYKDKEFEYGKQIEYLEFRNGCSIEEMEKELLDFKYLKFVEKQINENEKRYKTYHVYSSKKGRVYIVTFRHKIRVITIYTLGPGTLKKYNRAKFKK